MSPEEQTEIQKALIMGLYGTDEQKAQARTFLTAYLKTGDVERAVSVTTDTAPRLLTDAEMAEQYPQTHYCHLVNTRHEKDNTRSVDEFHFEERLLKRRLAQIEARTNSLTSAGDVVRPLPWRQASIRIERMTSAEFITILQAYIPANHMRGGQRISPISKPNYDAVSEDMTLVRFFTYCNIPGLHMPERKGWVDVSGPQFPEMLAYVEAGKLAFGIGLQSHRIFVGPAEQPRLGTRSFFEWLPAYGDLAVDRAALKDALDTYF